MESPQLLWMVARMVLKRTGHSLWLVRVAEGTTEADIDDLIQQATKGIDIFITPFTGSMFHRGTKHVIDKWRNPGPS